MFHYYYTYIKQIMGYNGFMKSMLMAFINALIQLIINSISWF